MLFDRQDLDGFTFDHVRQHQPRLGLFQGNGSRASLPVFLRLPLARQPLRPKESSVRFNPTYG